MWLNARSVLRLACDSLERSELGIDFPLRTSVNDILKHIRVVLDIISLAFVPVIELLRIRASYLFSSTTC